MNLFNMHHVHTSQNKNYLHYYYFFCVINKWVINGILLKIIHGKKKVMGWDISPLSPFV